jgi:hypothetical protein
MTNRSPKWPIFLGVVTSLSIGFTTSAAFFLHRDGLFDPAAVWFLYSSSATAALAFAALWSWYSYNRARRARAAELRKQRVARAVRDQAESDRTRAEQMVRASLLSAAEQKLRAVAAEEARQQRQAGDPTLTLPPFARARSARDVRMDLLDRADHASQLVPNLEPRREQFLRNWLEDTGEIPWPRTTGEAR